MTASRPPRQRLVPCPTCRQPARFDADNPYRPFCGERCRSIDLGAWAYEAYRVAAKGEADPSDRSDPPPGPPH